MDTENTPVVCRVCKRTFPMRDISFDENKKAFVCSTCLTTPQPMTMEEKTDTVVDDKMAEKLVASMVKYNCLKCKYHFQRPEGKVVKECPYCGNQIVEEANKDSADTILGELDEQ